MVDKRFCNIFDLKLLKIIILICTCVLLNMHAVTNHQKIDDYIQKYKDFSGVVLVTHNDEVIFKKGYGYANYEFDIVNNCTIKFPIASNTKSFTAVAILLLQEKKLLSVHDALSKHIPGFPGDITIHHLLTHTSGVSNYYNHWDSIRCCTSFAEMIGVIKTWELDFKPGSQYRYSNTGYLLLAHLIETVTGSSFEAFLKENIFIPSGMKSSGTLRDGQLIKSKACGYVMHNGHLCTVPAIDNPQILLGNGDVYASLDDMHCWSQALFSGKIINQTSLHELLYPDVAMQGSVHRFHGYGWFIDRRQGKRLVEYGGALAGYLSTVIRFIDDKVTIIVMTNREDCDQFAQIVDELPIVVFSE